jgi:SLT domain-containing protein
VAWNAIKAATSAIWGAIWFVISSAWGKIKSTASAAATWVKDKVVGVLRILRDKWSSIWSDMGGMLGRIWDRITGAVTSGVNAVIRVINWFIRLINKLPIVDIPQLGLVGGGGGGGRNAGGGMRERGTRNRASGGFVTNGPQYLVGEGSPAHPEAVIATDPRYRRRNLGLLAWAADKLGVPMGGRAYGIGGILGGFGDIVGKVTGPIRRAGSAVAGFLRDLSVRALSPLRDKAKDAINHLPGKLWFLRDFAKGMVDRMYDWAKGKETEQNRVSGGPGRNAGFGGGGVERWRSVALQALRMAGAPASWIGSLLRRMNQESGGNPRAINNWDSNARRGDPSRGLMQTIGSTFNAYVGHLRGRGIYDPLANIYAAIRYTISRYGSGPAGWDRSGGYRRGLRRVPHDDFPARLHKGEMVLTAGEARAVRGGRQRGRPLAENLTINIYDARSRREGRDAAKGFLDELERRKILDDVRIA